MNVPAPELAPLFRSDAQGELLARILLCPQEPATVAELSRSLSISYATAHREVDRLVRMGLVDERRVGRARLLSAEQNAPAYKPLVELLLLSYGPRTVLPRVLAPVPGIERAYIHGSWAARLAGEQGSLPRDLDIIVVGSPTRPAVHTAVEAAEEQLGRDVSVRVVASHTWHDGTNTFIESVQSRPLIQILPGPEASS